jgi:cysteine desulfurase/selenocysteine lyase
MSRSGYFCCHYYLLEKLKLPPLIRFSLGLHSTEDDIERTIKELRRVIKT